jgi:hypothetical protein
MPLLKDASFCDADGTYRPHRAYPQSQDIPQENSALMNVHLRSFLLVATVAAPLALAGCHISENKNGKNENVDIGTPFGGMHIKTNDAADIAGIGLATYPGAVPVKETNGKDDDAADINMSFGDFHLGVKAASFQTPDSPAKVEAFYRKDLAKYGDIIKCQGNHTIGEPVRTSQGLTCDDDGKKKKVHANINDSDNPELRAGSPTHQHVVGIEPRNGGTKIGLVLLDLPHNLDSDDKSKTSE